LPAALDTGVGKIKILDSLSSTWRRWPFRIC